MTFNLFFDEWIRRERLSFFLDTTLPRHLGWPDILCLQEVLYSQVHLLLSKLQDTYHVVHSAKINYDRYGVMLLAKKDSLNLIAQHEHIFLGRGKTEQGRSLLVMELAHVTSGVKMVAATSHLESLPRNREKRASQLLQSFAALQGYRKDSIVILGMDSNLEESSDGGPPGDNYTIPAGYRDLGADKGPTWFLNRIPKTSGNTAKRYDRIYLSLPRTAKVEVGELQNTVLKGTTATSASSGNSGAQTPDGHSFYISDHNALLVQLSQLELCDDEARNGGEGLELRQIKFGISATNPSRVTRAISLILPRTTVETSNLVNRTSRN